MVKASWGIKRTCQNCAARFYDLNKSPIKCPKCGREHDREDFTKVRRGRSAATAAAVSAAAAAAAAAPEARPRRTFTKSSRSCSRPHFGHLIGPLFRS